MKTIIAPLFSILLLGASCGRPALKPSDDWMPDSVGGPIEIRELPASADLEANYAQWIKATNAPRVRLYSEVVSSSEQFNFAFEVRRAESPLGRPLTTYASFMYSNETQGKYIFEWMTSGRQRAEAIKVDSRPRRFLLRVVQLKGIPVPRLQIVAIEGLEKFDMLVAEAPEEVR